MSVRRRFGVRWQSEAATPLSIATASCFDRSKAVSPLRSATALQIIVGLFLFATGASTHLFAHGDVHMQIVALTEQIEKEPKNAELHLRRAELHRAHQDWDSAYVDYERVSSLDPKMTVVDLGRGKMFLEANWPMSAKVSLDRFLTTHTNNVEGFATRARALVKLNQRLAAAKDYTAAIQYSSEPRPELYLERAQALTAEGTNHFDSALKGLDEGIQKLGPLVTLQLYAIDMEIKQRRYDAALQRLERVSAQSPRKETWLARRGEILQQAGRNDEARQAYEAAIAALNKLPPARRYVPAMQELEKRLQTAIESTKAGGGNSKGELERK